MTLINLMLFFPVMQTLRLFSDVAQRHSFSQAAALHGVTQPAASQRISRLEKRLGVTLIDRSVRPLELTAAGRIFLEGCESLIERYDRLEQKVGAAGKEPVGPVRVAAIYSVGIDLLSEVRERFEAAHRRISVEIRYDRPDRVYQLVRDSGFDLGILSYPRQWRKVDVVPLRDEVMAVVCRPDHELAGRQKMQARALADYPMVTFDADLPVGRQIRSYLKAHGASARITNVFDNLDTIKSAVAVTDQLSILPKRTVLREVASGALALIELTPRLVRPIGVIFRSKRRNGQALPPAAGAFVDFLVGHARPRVDLVDRPTTHGTPLLGDRA